MTIFVFNCIGFSGLNGWIFRLFYILSQDSGNYDFDKLCILWYGSIAGAAVENVLIIGGEGRIFEW